MSAVCYIGAFHDWYPRNQIIRAGLYAHGWTVRTAPISSGLSTARKLPLLWRSMRRAAPECDVFILAEFNQLLGPFAVLFARLLKKPLAIDYMVGLYDSTVLGRGTMRRYAPRALAFRTVDFLNLALAPVVFTDTDAHRLVMRRLVGRAANRLLVVPVGVYPDWWTPPQTPLAQVSGDRLRVLFFGHFIPFHGVDVILDAAKRLESDRRFEFELIGRGQTYPAAVQQAEALGLATVRFVDLVAPPDLPQRVAQADICLGVFATNEKTDYVVPNKVFQYMAMGKPVVTAESTALAQSFTSGEHMITVPPGDPAALADALRDLADHPARRQQIGAAAAAYVALRYHPAEVVRPLLAALAD
jgi:glycosyltransferase involved in cell wall biosynthesis